MQLFFVQGPYVVDLSKHAVNSFEEIQRWLVVGNRQRATAATSANEHSSRSHAIFTITLAQSKIYLFEGSLDILLILQVDHLSNWVIAKNLLCRSRRKVRW